MARRRLHELSPEEFAQEMDALRPLLRKADRDASWLLAKQLDELAAAEAVSPPRTRTVSAARPARILVAFAEDPPKSIRPREEEILLPAAGEAGKDFPEKWTLPASWTPGESIVLHFRENPDDGFWSIRRTGTTRGLRLTVHSGSSTSPPIEITDQFTRLPPLDPLEIDRLELTLSSR
jgi:hypothetical protein